MVKAEPISTHKTWGNQQYALGIALAVVFITCTYQAALFVKYTYIWGVLIFSFTFYYLVGRVLLDRNAVTPKRTTVALENGHALLKKVGDLMVTGKPLTSQRLKLDELASLVHIS